MDLDKDWDQQEPVSLPPVNEAGDLFNAWSWSPDGKLIAGTVAGWHDEEIRDEPGIYIYSLETGRYRKITDNGNRPEWLPDSRHLIFIKVVSGAAGQVSLADSQTKRPARVIVSPSPHIISSAGVASDGRRIFYTMNNHQVDIYLLSLDK